MTAVVSILALAGLMLVGWAWESSRRKRHPVRHGHRPEIELPYEREFELYHNALSLCSMKTRVCMAELEIPYKSHPIDLIETGAYENIRPAFLALNPGGSVPVLVHNGHPIYESHLQIRYAAEHAPPGSPRLAPEDPVVHAEMERWVDRSSLTEGALERGDESAGNAVPGLTLPLFAAMIERIPYWKILEGALFHFDRRRPFVFITFKLCGLSKLGWISPAMKVLARSRRQMGIHLDALEDKLLKEGGPWILGETFSLADVSWLVIFERLAQADCLHIFLGPDHRPHCAAYWEQLRSRRSYHQAILDHGHVMIDYGTTRLREAKAADPALRVALEGA